MKGEVPSSLLDTHIKRVEETAKAGNTNHNYMLGVSGIAGTTPSESSKNTSESKEKQAAAAAAATAAAAAAEERKEAEKAEKAEEGGKPETAEKVGCNLRWNTSHLSLYTLLPPSLKSSTSPWARASHVI